MIVTLPLERLHKLFETKGQRQAFPKGQALFFSDTQIITSLIESGYVKRYTITKEGDQSIQALYGPGDVFPLTPVFKAIFGMNLQSDTEGSYYSAMTRVTLRTIHRAEFEEACTNDPHLYRDLLYVCGVRLRSNIQRLDNIALKNAQKQVAHQLIFLAEHFGTELADNKIRIDVPLTHQSLADMLSLARETVTHAVNRLLERGLIETTPELTVTDMAGLRRLAR